MIIPSWLGIFLLVGAAARTYRLIAEDTILDRPRSWLIHLPVGWQEGDPVPVNYRHWLATWITCPWCAGQWHVLAWWGAFELSPHWATIVAVPAALGMALGLIIKHLDS